VPRKMLDTKSSVMPRSGRSARSGAADGTFSGNGSTARSRLAAADRVTI
jgi:hypothetical protein